MKFRSFAAAVGLLVAGAVSAPSFAQQQSQFTAAELAKIKADVRAAAEDYRRIFSARDTKGIVEKVWANPGISLGANGVSVMTPDKVAAMYDGLFQSLAKTDYDHSVFKDPIVCVLTPTNAIMSGKFQRINKDGTMLAELTASYLYTKTLDGWRLVTILGGQPGKVVTCD